VSTIWIIVLYEKAAPMGIINCPLSAYFRVPVNWKVDTVSSYFHAWYRPFAYLLNS